MLLRYLHVVTPLLAILPFAHAVSLTHSSHEAVHEWSYKGDAGGPANWATLFPQYCSGERQSPINIDTEQAQEINFDFLNLIGFSSEDRPANPTLTVKNNGHAVQLDINGHFFVEGGGLPGARYKVAQLHYHWGNPYGGGSEHTINGRRYDAEMHLVTYDTKYQSLSEAQENIDGIAVFGAFIQVGHDPNFAKSSLDEFFDKVWTMKHKGFSYTFPENKLRQLSDFLPDNIDWFYRYRGSLTTPTCDEHVVWTVWEQPVLIPPSKMDMFYDLFSNTVDVPINTKILDSYRPLQAVNGRPILHSHRNNW